MTRSEMGHGFGAKRGRWDKGVRGRCRGRRTQGAGAGAENGETGGSAAVE